MKATVGSMDTSTPFGQAGEQTVEFADEDAVVLLEAAKRATKINIVSHYSTEVQRRRVQLANYFKNRDSSSRNKY